MKIKCGKMVAFMLSLIIIFVGVIANLSSIYVDAATSIGALDENDVIYMVLTDRFYDGDVTNNGTLGVEYRPGELKYTQGGDWKGLTKKLNYIKNLGVTAIWISPISKNETLSRDGSESGYHGYFTHDYASPDPHFGTKSELINFVREAHKRNLKVF